MTDQANELPFDWLDGAVRDAADQARRTAGTRRTPAQRVVQRRGDTEPLVERLVLSVPQVARALQIGRRQAYEMVWRGDLPVVRIGQRSLRISKADLDRYIERSSRPYGP